ncbi:MAG: formyltransferase family protein [Rhodospirillales bacterium]
MADRLILLTGPEEAAVLAPRIAELNPDLLVSTAADRDSLEAAFQEPATRRRLVAFSTGVIVPARLLALCDRGAINFHPGTPEYPGNQIAAFAAYDGAAGFGATAHFMRPAVDSGPIIAVRREAMPPGGTRTDYALTGYRNLVFLFNDLEADLCKLDHMIEPNGDVWSGPVRKLSDLDHMRLLPRDTDAVEFDRRLRAFEDSEAGSLQVDLFGYRFRICTGDAT